MSAHSQPLTASILCLLPRILPAPQALLKPSRPSRLPPTHAIIAGVHSGIRVDELNHFAGLIFGIALPKFATRVVKIRHNPKLQEDQRKNQRPVEEYPDRVFRTPKGVIHSRSFSPLACLTVASSLLSAGLIVWACFLHDGVACVAIALISLTTSVIGLSNFWHPSLIPRKQRTLVPPGDLVIRTRQGAFIVIKCTEEVARELYTSTEECKYVVGDSIHRGLVGVGTFLLMCAVVLMGNCTWVMQAALGVSYILLNGLYQVAALLPTHWHWNFSRYIVDEVLSERTQQNTYTQALWQAIKASGSTEWVRLTNAAPVSGAWSTWLEEAQDHLNAGCTGNWDPQEAVNRLLKLEATEDGIVLGPARDVPISGFGGARAYSDYTPNPGFGPAQNVPRGFGPNGAVEMSDGPFHYN
ncbi:hypothetical protein L873DRAFT_1787421 [Choiromyces venosus 120613-1]|uniref:Uncharacterized protein n=1 Tax=Choiromyces venosus 120613-1 TaxID=1336337 RepID=A0A3N4JXE5_9PEZI|nr:hypothetical protein L873DRAFT_1787421 [Choiromyces venosus 120613-1]